MNDYIKYEPIFVKKTILTNMNPYSFFADKMCDQISDAVLDAHLRLDPDSKVRITAINNCKLMI